MNIDIDLKAIGKRILSRRKELSLTQEKLAEMVDMSVNQLSNLEKNKCVPTIKTILMLSENLNVTPDYFLLGISKHEDDLPHEIAEKCLLCTEYQQEIIKEIVTAFINQNC